VHGAATAQTEIESDSIAKSKRLPKLGISSDGLQLKSPTKSKHLFDLPFIRAWRMNEVSLEDSSKDCEPNERTLAGSQMQTLNSMIWWIR
jgi:hypothetical protein